MRFSKYFPITVCVPIAIIVIGLIVGIACGGMNLGIDFTGGTMMTIHMGEDFDSSVVAEAFVNEGFTEQQISVTVSGSGADAEALMFLNRLSDYFYALGRMLTAHYEVDETLWIP